MQLYSTVSSYTPQVFCTRPIFVSIQSSCQNILNTMPVSQEEFTFGPQSNPSARVKLPLTIRSCEWLSTACSNLAKLADNISKADKQCEMTVQTFVTTDVTSWYDIWAVGVAINGMCVRIGHNGEQFGIGRVSIHILGRLL